MHFYVKSNLPKSFNFGIPFLFIILLFCKEIYQSESKQKHTNKQNKMISLNNKYYANKYTPQW